VTIQQDKGSISIVMMAIVALGVSFAIHIGDAGRSLVLTARAQAVADATALAGVHGARAGSERIARDNGAVLVLYEETTTTSGDGSTVRVSIEIEGRWAQAWASDES
jgi:hypothetical protein